jgi:hypothetical protein
MKQLIFSLIVSFMEEEVFPFLKQFKKDAGEYREKRDENNVKLFELMEAQYKFVSCILSGLEYVKVEVMSSINAKLNLADNDSDIDFGIIVDGLNNGHNGCINIDKYTKVAQILTNNGFMFTGILHPSVISNQYFSFEKKINGIEFELKIRDNEASQSVIKLHKFLDTELEQEHITLFTYAKYLFKKFDESHKKGAYNKFKGILYNWAFSNVEGGFKLGL